MNSNSVSQSFETLFQTGDINIFVLRGIFLVDMLKQKALFLTKKTSAFVTEAHFRREAIEN